MRGKDGSELGRESEAEGEGKGRLRTAHMARVYGAAVAHPSPIRYEVWHHESTQNLILQLQPEGTGCGWFTVHPRDMGSCRS